MRARDFRKAIVALSVWACSVLPAGAQGVGAISGTVTDTSDAIMPGVAITLSSTQGTIGANQQTVTDERGAYQFLRLVPGSYIVKAELQGFRPTEQRNITVNADGTSRADLKLQIGTMAEGVTVTGEAPLLDTTSALKQTVIPNETLKALPNRFDVWSAARLSPVIIMSQVDVGGSAAFLQSGPTLHGSSSDNGYSIDGMDYFEGDKRPDTGEEFHGRAVFGKTAIKDAAERKEIGAAVKPLIGAAVAYMSPGSPSTASGTDPRPPPGAVRKRPPAGHKPPQPPQPKSLRLPRHLGDDP